MALAWKLLTLLAVLLLPLGMSVAPAATVQHHAATLPMQHCPDQAPTRDAKPGFVECMMACSAALPAADLDRAEPLPIACPPERADVVRQLHGLQPETATPPPKRT